MAESSTPTTNSVEASQVILRSVIDSRDLPLLYAWRSNLETLPFWHSNRHPVSSEQFEREFREQEATRTHVRFMIQLGDQTIGTIYSHSQSAINGWAYLTLYLAAEHRSKQLGPAAARQFIAWLFANYPLRKLYAEVYGFNSHSAAILRAAGLEPEAILKDHLYWQGGYHDLLIFSITPNQLVASAPSARRG